MIEKQDQPQQETLANLIKKIRTEKENYLGSEILEPYENLTEQQLSEHIIKLNLTTMQKEIKTFSGKKTIAELQKTLEIFSYELLTSEAKIKSITGKTTTLYGTKDTQSGKGQQISAITIAQIKKELQQLITLKAYLEAEIEQATQPQNKQKTAPSKKPKKPTGPELDDATLAQREKMNTQASTEIAQQETETLKQQQQKLEAQQKTLMQNITKPKQETTPEQNTQHLTYLKNQYLLTRIQNELTKRENPVNYLKMKFSTTRIDPLVFYQDFSHLKGAQQGAEEKKEIMQLKTDITAADTKALQNMSWSDVKVTQYEEFQELLGELNLLMEEYQTFLSASYLHMITEGNINTQSLTDITQQIQTYQKHYENTLIKMMRKWFESYKARFSARRIKEMFKNLTPDKYKFEKTKQAFNYIKQQYGLGDTPPKEILDTLRNAKPLKEIDKSQLSHWRTHYPQWIDFEYQKREVYIKIRQKTKEEPKPKPKNLTIGEGISITNTEEDSTQLRTVKTPSRTIQSQQSPQGHRTRLTSTIAGNTIVDRLYLSYIQEETQTGESSPRRKTLRFLANLHKKLKTQSQTPWPWQRVYDAISDSWYKQTTYHFKDKTVIIKQATAQCKTTWQEWWQTLARVGKYGYAVQEIHTIYHDPTTQEDINLAIPPDKYVETFLDRKKA